MSDLPMGRDLKPLVVRGQTRPTYGLAYVICLGCGRQREVTTWNRLCEECS